LFTKSDEMHIYHGGAGASPVDPPVVLGHEFAGVVEAVGAEVTGCKVGDYVTVDPNIYCRKCMPCRMGKVFAVEQALDAAGFGATVLLFSVPETGTAASLSLNAVFDKELTIAGSRINPDTQQRAVNLLNSGRLQIKKLITHVYDLEHLEDAIKMQMSNESIKVVVHP